MADLGRGWLLLTLFACVACNQVEVAPDPVPIRHAAAQPAAPTETAPVSRAQAPQDAQDVVLVTIDTLRPDHLGVYGAKGASTPVLDTLAAEGVRFEEAFASAPLTLPSHASMLTGNYPPRHGVRHNGVFRLRGESVTLAERFQAAGWKTGAVVGAFVLSRQFGLDQGFDSYDDAFGEKRSSGSGFQERTATEVTDRALEWLGKTEGPYFLWVHYYDPHSEYEPPAPYDKRFQGRPYDGEIAYVDAELGRLLEAVKDRGRWDQTHVAVTSDHGESLGEHEESTHGYFLYDAVLRVPLILRGPGVAVGVRRDLASNTSIAPTLAGLAGLGGFDEADTPSLLAPKDEAGVHPYAEALAAQFDFGWAPLYAIRDKEHSLIESPAPELYEIATDAEQLENLWSADADAELLEVHTRLKAQLDARLEAARPMEPSPIDAETAAQIEALGYLVTREPTERTGMNPRDGKRWIELSTGALADYLGQRFIDAQAKALEVLEEYPDSGRMHGILARIGVATGRSDQARPHAEALVRLQGENADHHALLGLVLMRLGDLKGAVEAFESGLKVDPGHYGAHLGAMWKHKTGAPVQEAQYHADEAVRLAGEDVSVLDRVGETWEGLGEYERALKAYQRVLALDPDSMQGHMRLAIQYARLGDHPAYLNHLAAAGEASDRPDMRNRLGITLAARGDHAEAEEIFRTLIHEHPTNQLARLNLSRLLGQTGRGDEAASLRAPLPAAAAE